MPGTTRNAASLPAVPSSWGGRLEVRGSSSREGFFCAVNGVPPCTLRAPPATRELRLQRGLRGGQSRGSDHSVGECGLAAPDLRVQQSRPGASSCLEIQGPQRIAALRPRVKSEMSLDGLVGTTENFSGWAPWAKTAIGMRFSDVFACRQCSVPGHRRVANPERANGPSND